MNKLFKRSDFKPYIEDMCHELNACGNLEYLIQICHDILHSNNLTHLKDNWCNTELKSMLVDNTVDLNNLSVENVKKLVKVCMGYYKKELIISKRKRRLEDKEEKQRLLFYNISKRDDILYEGEANSKMLQPVVSKLNLYSKFTKKSAISVRADTHRTSEDSSNGRYTFYKHFASGCITIDGIEYYFEDIEYHHSGWDNFPPG